MTTPQKTDSPRAVYECIAACAADIARDGIAKGRRNEQQGYAFRGVDDLYNAMAPILARHRLVILPRVMSRAATERTTAKGGLLFCVVVEVEFDFVSAADSSRHTIKTYGEAMDSGDKATNKAMSAAYKYACMQAFCIPVEGDNDADATTHDDVVPQPEPPPPQSTSHTSSSSARLISDPQRKRMYAIGKKAGWTDDEMKRLLSRHGFAQSAAVTRDEYEAICRELEEGSDTEPPRDTHPGVLRPDPDRDDLCDNDDIF